MTTVVAALAISASFSTTGHQSATNGGANQHIDRRLEPPVPARERASEPNVPVAADRIWLLPKHGALSVGAPEDLVLSGAFERAFAGEGVQFDAGDGVVSYALGAAG